jgi:hypothetical protein
MFRKWQLVFLPVALLVAADPNWKDKELSSWTEDDAKQVLADSPWVKSVTPSMTKNTQSNSSPGRDIRAAAWAEDGAEG